MSELREKGVAEVRLGGRPFLIKERFLDDLEQHDLLGSIGDLRKALLVMHSPMDAVVDIENASQLFLAAKHPKSFVSLDSADHLLSLEEDSRYVGRLLASWATRYLPESGALAVAPPESVDGAVVARTFIDGFRTRVVVGKHSLLADEPLSAGGTDRGPTPYDLLAAALATCTSMTLKMYASFKGLHLRSATVEVRHGKVHAADCADCDRKDGKIDEFQRVITLDGDLTEDQRQRMLEIADRCPVHKTLHGEIKVRSSLKES